MNRIDTVSSILVANAVFKKAFQFRQENKLNEASFDDLIQLFLYKNETGSGLSTFALTMLRYGYKCGSKCLRDRINLLTKKGFVYRSGGKINLTDKAIKELSGLISLVPEEILPVIRSENTRRRPIIRSVNT